MPDKAYRAVFLRIHPTGKMVLSLTTEADGNEGSSAQTIAELALYAHGTGALPVGVEGGLDAQTVYGD